MFNGMFNPSSNNHDLDVCVPKGPLVIFSIAAGLLRQHTPSDQLIYTTYEDLNLVNQNNRQIGILGNKVRGTPILVLF